MAMAAPVCRGARAGMIAPRGTNPASRMPKTVPAITATTNPQSEPAGTQCGTYHQANRPIAEPRMPNQRTVKVQLKRSPIAPKTALNAMLPPKTTEVISSQRDWPQPRVSAITVGRMMNIPNCGAVLIRRVRKPIITRWLVSDSRRPARITCALVSPSGARRLVPCRSEERRVGEECRYTREWHNDRYQIEVVVSREG